ncbi:TPA: hypothetical protein DIV49_01245 [Candidatus Saccharibacteria bacterium]|nr:hypothetical protein [Candidatus Saccharibacteria bacterium]HRJ90981.1 O-antigen ligase family protein [Candidatus Saccharibacteria bacterium]
MKQKTFEYYYAVTLAAVLFLVWFHAPISVGVGSIFPSAELYIKAWKEIALGILFVGAIVWVTNNALWRQLLASRLLQMVLGLATLHLLVATVLFDNWQSVLAGLVIDLRFLLVFSLAYVAALMHPKTKPMLVWSAVVGGALTVAFGLIQLTVLPKDALSTIGYGKDTITSYTTIDKNPDFIRIQSTQRGPNPLGALCAILLAGALSFALLRWKKLSQNHRYVLATGTVATSIVLYATYSRSAYLAAAIAAGVVVAIAVKTHRSRAVILAEIVIAVAVITGAVLLQQTDWYKNVVLHEDPESTVVVKSNDQHVESLASGWKRLTKQPLGAGIGSTGSASIVSEQSPDVTIENYYLFVAHEVGWLGFGLFIALTGMVLHQLWVFSKKDWVARALFASGIGLAIAALFLPVWADDTTAIVWWGLAGVVIASHTPIKQRKP